MKIAIFGGAFNPVHREHVHLARTAIEELGLDKLIIMPTAISPHKSGKAMADFFQRFEMCRIAFRELKQAEVSNYELARGGVSYTYLTCNHFASLYPDAERYLLIGADMLENFPEWKNPQEILKNFRLAACAREDAKPFLGYKKMVEEEFDTAVKTLSYVGENVSSTQIRTYAALGEDISRFVNPDVCQYIRRKGLYAMHGLWGVKQFLKPERWQHTLRVAVICAKNSARADISEEQAITMAALHDVAKYMSADSPYLTGFVCPDGVPGPVVHQFAGAYVAENVFKIGLTRRLDPTERIDELSNASVPFPFQIHAIIESEDAPALEAKLHRIFYEQKMNKNNWRKEFFKITTEDIRKVLKEEGIEASIVKDYSLFDYGIDF